MGGHLRHNRKMMSNHSQLFVNLGEHFHKLGILRHLDSFQGFFDQRALAALAAICERFLGLRLQL